MNTKLKKEFELKNITYSDICSHLSNVTFGKYYLPNPTDESTVVDNEYSFLAWKEKIISKYPNARVVLDPKAGRKISLIDTQFEYDRNDFIENKARILRYESGLY